MNCIDTLPGQMYEDDDGVYLLLYPSDEDEDDEYVWCLTADGTIREYNISWIEHESVPV